jgi:Tfp pilus assembly protein PilO
MRIWVPGAALCVLGLGLLGGYRLVLAEEAELGRGLLARRAAELEELEATAARLERVVESARETEEGLDRFYDEHLSTREQMLTTVLAEVKDLAEQAGLMPAAIRYDNDSLARQNLEQQSLDFRVTGTYEQLRTLINFIELSDSFLVLEQVSLFGNDEQNVGRVAITLRVSALFATGREQKPRSASS